LGAERVRYYRDVLTRMHSAQLRPSGESSGVAQSWWSVRADTKARRFRLFSDGESRPRFMGQRLYLLTSAALLPISGPARKGRKTGQRCGTLIRPRSSKLMSGSSWSPDGRRSRARDAGFGFARQPFTMSNHFVEILFHSGRGSVCLKSPGSRRRCAIIEGRLHFRWPAIRNLFKMTSVHL